MYTPIYTKQFEKDLRLCQRRGKNLEKFKIVARSLLAEEYSIPFTETINSLVTTLDGETAILNQIGY